MDAYGTYGHASGTFCNPSINQSWVSLLVLLDDVDTQVDLPHLSNCLSDFVPHIFVMSLGTSPEFSALISRVISVFIQVGSKYNDNNTFIDCNST